MLLLPPHHTTSASLGDSFPHPRAGCSFFSRDFLSHHIIVAVSPSPFCQPARPHRLTSLSDNSSLLHLLDHVSMAEVQSRGGGSSRGRGGLRGGRGGFRGTRNTSRSQHKPDNEQENIPPTASLEDQGEVGELLKRYGNKVPLLKEICPGWSDQDLVYALNETDGDVESAFDRISAGNVAIILTSSLLY